MRSRVLSPPIWLATTCLLFLPALARAQTIASATVTGTVRDASDAVVPGATVEIRNHETNQMWSAATDGRGPLGGHPPPSSSSAIPTR